MAHEIKCIIAACNNNLSVREAGAEVWFYEFPTDQEFRQKWITKCGKSDNWDQNCCYVCSEHFSEADFEPSAESEASVKRKLVPTAVPILKLHNECEILETINEGNELPITGNEQTKAAEDTLESNKNVIPAESYEQLLQNYQKVAQLHDDLKRHLCISKKSLDTKTRQIKKLEKEVTELRLHLDTQHLQNDRFEQALQYFLTGVQKHLAISQKTNGDWNTETLVRTLAIRYLSERCYNYLCQNLLYPLPDLFSLQQWVTKINFRQGILHEFLCIMQIIAKELTDSEKIAVLQFGNTKVKYLYEHDEITDEVVGPYSHMQVVVVTALFAEWKQPIYLAFDTKMGSGILVELIKKLHDMSYTILACISDWHEGMSDLWKELKINPKRPYFRHPVTNEKVYYFLDAPSLLRNIRNVFIEQGFTLNTGKVVNTEPLKQLINSTHTESEYPSMINKEHLEFCKDEHHDLMLAGQLFCCDTATNLKRSSSSLAHSTGVFIENISKWYSVAKQTYGSKMYEENLILNATADMISKLITKETTQVYLLQEAMLMSINSLRLLPLNLWGRYNTVYNIPTEKLNNKELNDLFDQIRGKTHNITPLKAVGQLRTIILGRNQENQNYLTTKILSSLNYPDVKSEDGESISLDNSRSNISSIVCTEDNEIHYLVASVTDKFLTIHPEYGKRIRDLTLDPPYENTLVNIESFVEPSDSWASQARQLNKIFTKFHKKELVTGSPEITKQLTDIVKQLYPDIDLNVAKYFLEERLMLRIKYLNAELEKSQKQSEAGESQGTTSSDN